MSTFDTDNHSIIESNMDNTFLPSANVVVLSFVNAVKLMNLTNDSGDMSGIPIGTTPAVVNYFHSRGIRVMLPIGGVSSQSIGKSASEQPQPARHQRGKRGQAFQRRRSIDGEAGTRVTEPVAPLRLTFARPASERQPRSTFRRERSRCDRSRRDATVCSLWFPS